MRAIWISLIILSFYPVLTVNAQSSPDAICVLAYEDGNMNGQRDSGELPLPGISVNLAVQNDVIIATHITTSDNSSYCFQNLAPDTYTLTFEDSLNHKATTQNRTPPIQLSSGQSVRVDFGAVPVDPVRSQEEAAQNPEETDKLDSTTRLMLALLGAVIAMIFMIGFGAVLVSVLY